MQLRLEVVDVVVLLVSIIIGPAQARRNTVKQNGCFNRKWLPQLQSSEDQNVLPTPQCCTMEVTSFLNYHISTSGE